MTRRDTDVDCSKASGAAEMSAGSRFWASTRKRKSRCALALASLHACRLRETEVRVIGETPYARYLFFFDGE